MNKDYRVVEYETFQHENFFDTYSFQFSAIGLIRSIDTIEFVVAKKCVTDLLTRPVTIAMFQAKKI